eukprot:scaffold9715_cov47-Phaeocystis_antarctica.AAC.3
MRRGAPRARAAAGGRVPACARPGPASAHPVNYPHTGVCSRGGAESQRIMLPTKSTRDTTHARDMERQDPHNARPQ